VPRPSASNANIAPRDPARTRAWIRARIRARIRALCKFVRLSDSANILKWRDGPSADYSRAGSARWLIKACGASPTRRDRFRRIIFSRGECPLRAIITNDSKHKTSCYTDNTLYSVNPRSYGELHYQTRGVIIRGSADRSEDG